MRRPGIAGCVAMLVLGAVPAAAAPAGAAAPPGLLRTMLADPAAAAREIVFAVRSPGADPHWYANFAYWCPEPDRMMYGRDGGRLCKLDLETGRVTVLLDDPRGGVRDPTVDYDARKVLFSYRKGGTRHYNLYEIGADGTGLRQLTDGPWDDIEPAYLPSGEIVFASSRCKRWVGCWYTQVAILYRMAADGTGLRPISSNIEHDNTPAVLPDGRILYTRWEYVDRSQVDFHHLWTINPDGTGQMTFFGNMHPGTLMIDAKPIPGSDRVVAIFSPGHGANEHCGTATIIDPRAGPDERAAAQAVRGAPGGARDPFPLSADWLLVCRRSELHLVHVPAGRSEIIYTHPGGGEVHEPAPLRPRPREPVIPDRADWTKAAGRMVLADVRQGRNMDGVGPGEVRKLLVLETLPKPVNFSGGPDALTWLGTFSLERVLGTVPVEADGSAYFEVPAHRPVFFVALGAGDLAVKRMQSFTSVMPGETSGCVGCHEPRTRAAGPSEGAAPLALRRPPSRIEPLEGQPQVVDFPRDVQPILDRHCAKCHDYDKRAGRVVLAGDRGPMFSHSYWTLLARGQVADGRNAWSNNPPRAIGSAASPLMKKIDGSHHGAKLTPREWRTVWLWIESGATYAGTYAALDTGRAGVPVFHNPENPNEPAPVFREAREAIYRRCAACHALPPTDKRPREKGKVPLPAEMASARGARHQRVVLPDDPIARLSPQVLFNLTRPEKSLILLGPLAKEARGYGSCRALGADAPARPAEVFRDASDPDYRKILAAVARAGERLDAVKRFDMAGFRPNVHYVREMKRFGVLPPAFDPARDPIDVYETDEAYWRSLWWTPLER